MVVMRSYKLKMVDHVLYSHLTWIAVINNCEIYQTVVLNIDEIKINYNSIGITTLHL